MCKETIWDEKNTGRENLIDYTAQTQLDPIALESLMQITVCVNYLLVGTEERKRA